MSRFPKLTETFVLDEMLEMERQGVAVELYPLWRENTSVIHPEVAPLLERAHFLPTLNLTHLRSGCYWLINRPRRLIEALLVLLTANAGSARYWLGALAIIPKALTMARTLQAANVLHLHAHFASHPAAAAYLIGRLTDIPWSFTAHGSDLHREQAMLRQKLAACRFAVTISAYNRKFIADRVGLELASKVRVVRCGVQPEVFPACRRSEEEALNVICIGTLHEVKGQRTLLEACALLQLTEWHCHLVGDGPDREALAQLTRELGISGNVTFHGRQPRDAVRELLGAANVACAPSVPSRDGRREGIPVVLLEAAACGLPLVASRLSGIPEIVIDRETGLLFEPGDSKALAVALARLACEPQTRARLGAAARQHLANGFLLRENVQELRSLMLGSTTSRC